MEISLGNHWIVKKSLIYNFYLISAFSITYGLENLLFQGRNHFCELRIDIDFGLAYHIYKYI